MAVSAEPGVYYMLVIMTAFTDDSTSLSVHMSGSVYDMFKLARYFTDRVSTTSSKSRWRLSKQSKGFLRRLHPGSMYQDYFDNQSTAPLIIDVLDISSTDHQMNKTYARIFAMTLPVIKVHEFHLKFDENGNQEK